MDYKHTFTKSRLALRNSGMTLIEVVVAMGIGIAVLAVIGSLALWSGKSFAAMANYADLDNASRNALDRMTSEVREVQGLISYAESANEKELVLRDSDGQPLYFRYNPGSKTLTKVKNGNTETLLKDCTTLNFNLYQRNNVSNTFNQYQVASGTNAALTCKVIQVNWICSRRLLPTTLLNSESVQTAKIVIRHH
jgi:Tfp pilus assembly protein PilW